MSIKKKVVRPYEILRKILPQENFLTNYFWGSDLGGRYKPFIVNASLWIPTTIHKCPKQVKVGQGEVIVLPTPTSPPPQHPDIDFDRSHPQK